MGIWTGFGAIAESLENERITIHIISDIDWTKN